MQISPTGDGKRGSMEQSTDINSSKAQLHCGDLTICLHSKVVTVGRESVLLTPLEFDLIAYLARNQDRPVSPTELLEEVWKCPDWGTLNQVRSCIKRLRKKLSANRVDGNTGQQYIHTVRGWGYRLCSLHELFPLQNRVQQSADTFLTPNRHPSGT